MSVSLCIVNFSFTMLHHKRTTGECKYNLITYREYAKTKQYVQRVITLTCRQWVTELQIIFEPDAYLPPTFWLNADFQNFKWYLHPLYFFAMLKKEVLLFFSVYLQFCVVLDISFVVICFCLWYDIANACFCHNTCCNAKEATDNMLANRQTDGPLQSRVLLFF